MNFWKKHPTLRAIGMAAFSASGLALTWVGWKMTGQLEGLLWMLGGILLMLLALYLYNKAYQ